MLSVKTGSFNLPCQYTDMSRVADESLPQLVLKPWIILDSVHVTLTKTAYRSQLAARFIFIFDSSSVAKTPWNVFPTSALLAAVCPLLAARLAASANRAAKSRVGSAKSLLQCYFISGRVLFYVCNSRIVACDLSIRKCCLSIDLHKIYIHMYVCSVCEQYELNYLLLLYKTTKS